MKEKLVIVSGCAPKIKGEGHMSRPGYYSRDMGVTRYRKFATRMTEAEAASIVARLIDRGFINVMAK